MNNLNQNMPVHNGNNKPVTRSARKDYPGEVEEIYQQESLCSTSRMACEPSKEREPSPSHST